MHQGRFRNLARPGQPNKWGISVASGNPNAGELCTVTKRDGTTQEYTLGRFVLFQYGEKVFEIAAEPNRQAPQERQRYRVGEMSQLLALFDRAAQHLRFPGVVLKVHDTEYTIRVKRAGAQSSAPGTLNVTDENIMVTGRYGRSGKWYGRVHRNGDFEMANDTPLIIATRLKDLAADPVRVASEHGRLTGRCCFCNKALDDERSTAVGYGRVCAGHYGLPWGDRPAAFAAAPAAVEATPTELATRSAERSERRRKRRVLIPANDGNE